MFIVSIQVQPTGSDPTACGMGKGLTISQLKRNMLQNGIQGLEPGHILRSNVRIEKLAWDLASGM